MSGALTGLTALEALEKAGVEACPFGLNKHKAVLSLPPYRAYMKLTTQMDYKDCLDVRHILTQLNNTLYALCVGKKLYCHLCSGTRFRKTYSWRVVKSALLKTIARKAREDV